MNLSITNKCNILIVMNLLLLSILLWQFYPSSNDRTQSHYVTSQAVSIAISKIKYGLDEGYVGYRKIINILYNIGGDNDKGVLISRVNEEISKTLNLTDVASDGLHYMPCLPTWSDFVTAAFYIFGPNAKSLFYFYMLLLTVSIMTFIVSFRHNNAHLYLSLITIVTFIVMINAPAVVTMTRVSHRFWPYLAIVPAFHIAIQLVDSHRLARWKLIGSLIQAFILVFIIHCRNVAMYEFIFLFMAIPLYIIIGHIIKSRGRNALISFIQKGIIWPLVSLIICFVAMTIYSQVKLYPDYSKIRTGYPFWHMIYISLSAHPDACKKYDICKFSDTVAYKLVEKSTGKPFDGNTWSVLAEGKNPSKGDFFIFFSPTYAKILKDETMRIIMNDPWFFISGFYYKIINFPSVYLNGSDNNYVGYVSPVHPLYNSFIPQFDLRWFLISMVIIGFFLAKKPISYGWQRNYSLVLLMFLSSFTMLLMAYPDYSTIMDPSFTLTALIYIGISIYFYYIWHFILMVKKTIKIKLL